MYEFRMNGAGNAYELLIYGDIGKSWDAEEESNDAKTVIKNLREADGKQPLKVRINSKGGSGADGVAIHNAIREYAGPSETVIEVEAFSVGSYIAMAGDKITAKNNAMLMIHGPSGVVAGNSGEMREGAEHLDKWAGLMVDGYSRGGKVSADTIKGWLTDGKDHFFTAKEALDEGLVDDINIPSVLSHSNTEVSMKVDTSAMDEGVRKEAARAKDIRMTFKKFPFMAELCDQCLDDPKCSVDAARAKLIGAIEAPARPVVPVASGRQGDSGSSFQLEAGPDEMEKRRQGMAEAIYMRAGKKGKLDRANPWRGHRLVDLAREEVEACGADLRGIAPIRVARMALSPQMSGGMQTTSDFPNVLADVMHKIVLDGYAAVPQTWRMFAAEGSVTDLRAWAQLVPGLLGNLLPVNEAGNYEQISIPDAEKNTIQARRTGRILMVSADTIINDDLSYIDAQASAAGQMGGRTVEHSVFTLLESNPVMSDGIPLFHASHGNLAATGGVPSVESIQEADTAMNAQTAPQVTGEDAQLLDVTPYAVVAHRGRKSLLQSLNEATEVYDATAGEKIYNSANGSFNQIVATSRVAPLPWYVFADPSIHPCLKVVFLNGQSEPEIEQEEHFESGGLRWRVELPHGAGAVDYRGGFKNAGA